MGLLVLSGGDRPEAGAERQSFVELSNSLPSHIRFIQLPVLASHFLIGGPDHQSSERPGLVLAKETLGH
jgi:hypothetical protein